MCLGQRAMDSLRHPRTSAGPAAEAQVVREHEPNEQEA